MEKLLKIRDLPVHTLLFSIYPILYLYARNIVFIPGDEVIRPLYISLGLAVFFLVGFLLVLRRWDKAGLLASLTSVLILTFGHIYNQLESILPLIKTNPASVTYLGWGWAVLFLVISFFILRANVTRETTRFLNIISLVLILFPLVTILSTLIATSPTNLQFEREKMADIRHEKTAEASSLDLRPGEKPDIYYIIFDSYERADKLKDLYDFDNSDFVSQLKNRGFYVAPSSRSNYLNTTYSLNTALNLLYFSDFPANVMRNAKLNLRTNYLNDFLRRQGYEIIVFDSGTGDSNNQYADQFISPVSNNPASKPLLNPFETLTIRTTIGLIFLKGNEQHYSTDSMNAVMAATVNRELDIRRSRIYSALDHLPDFASTDTPQFLFAHIYLPHIPFLFGTGGKELTYQQNMNFYWYEPPPENFVEQYLYQIEYLNKAILPTIDRIQAESKRPVVIVLQSDHGDDKFLNWDAPTKQGVDARSSTLSAIYFSDGDQTDFYPTMTTVNTFRLVLNHWFGTQYPLLPEKVYFHNHPLTQAPGEIPRFIEACEQFDLCLPTPP